MNRQVDIVSSLDTRVEQDRRVILSQRPPGAENATTGCRVPLAVRAVYACLLYRRKKQRRGLRLLQRAGQAPVIGLQLHIPVPLAERHDLALVITGARVA